MSQNNHQKKSQSAKKVKFIDVPHDADGVVCDGGHGGLGHPRVWYGFDSQGMASCHYCGHKFSKAQS